MSQQCPKEFVMKAEELDRTVQGDFFRVREKKMGVKQSALKRGQAVQRWSAPPEKKVAIKALNTRVKGPARVSVNRNRYR